MRIIFILLCILVAYATITSNCDDIKYRGDIDHDE